MKKTPPQTQNLCFRDILGVSSYLAIHPSVSNYLIYLPTFLGISRDRKREIPRIDILVCAHTRTPVWGVCDCVYRYPYTHTHRCVYNFDK